MNILSRLFGIGSQSAAVVVLETQLPYGDPQEHARILDDILRKAGVRVDRQVYTILLPGCRERSGALLAKACEHYFSQTIGPGYDESRLKMTPFESPEACTSGVVLSHP